MELNEADSKILQQMMSQGRITWAELAHGLELSAPAAADRVRRLEEKGVIQGYTARINPEAIGCHLTAFVAVTLEHPRHREGFLQLVQQLTAIQECHHVTGDDDYLLKIRCRHTRDLEHLVSEQLKSLPGILRTRTTIVLSTVKETSDLPLYRETEVDNA
ncbi:Lrp/AsnC family transcriptional regulator [Leptolyngbya ohadii]|uniref:Lrp/AsnC family transcriptional regulator n=1 Tax=Leptolyngbya ohadii TaxID=1962290 RepID=UPI000B599304|nr:Lrp/AsnC family transcriptional regulator [Leptolyngbya ohadii]